MSAALDRTTPPPRGALRPFHFPAVQRRTLSSGLTLLVAEVRNFPVVSVDLVLDAGGLAENGAPGGVAALTSALLESGAGELDAAAIAERVDAMGLSLDAGVSWDTAQCGFTAIRARLEPAFALLAELVCRPTFPQHELERLRDERIAAVQQRRGSPSGLADEAAARWAYSPATPYARPLGGTLASLGAIGREQVAAFHAARFRPASSTLVAAGDVDADEIALLAERWLGDWRGAAAPLQPPLVAPRLEQTRVLLVDRPGAVQSELRVIHPGPSRTTPDYFALTVMNAILGGTFSSRLNLNLRERLGYTYGVSSAFVSRRHGGAFTLATALQTEGTAHALQEIVAELRRMQREEVTPAELDDARNYLAGVFPLALQTTDGVAGKLNTLATFGLPDDYFEHYRAGILAVTAAQVQAAAEAHLWPEQAALVVAGPAAELRPALEAAEVGEVLEVDLAELEG